jgi:hypothetical protein
MSPVDPSRRWRFETVEEGISDPLWDREHVRYAVWARGEDGSLRGYLELKKATRDLRLPGLSGGTVPRACWTPCRDLRVVVRNEIVALSSRRGLKSNEFGTWKPRVPGANNSRTAQDQLVKQVYATASVALRSAIERVVHDCGDRPLLWQEDDVVVIGTYSWRRTDAPGRGLVERFRWELAKQLFGGQCRLKVEVDEKKLGLVALLREVSAS